MKRLRGVALLSVCCLCILFLAWSLTRGKSKEETETEETELFGLIETEETEEFLTETEEELPEEDPNRNPLTGEPMDEALASQRPVSFMMGNTVDSAPQYGLSDADIIYEAPAEGGITRLMTIYQDYANLPTIMSSRSCRHYYCYLSNEYEAIYIHYGQAVYATEMLKKFDDLNGLDGDLENVTFFRDHSRQSPHNAYVNGESIVAGIQKREYRTQHAAGYENRLKFVSEDRDLEGGDTAVVAEPGYSVNKPWFVYDEATGLYDRFQYKGAHVDGATGEQIAFKNIIFQVCDYSVEPDGKYLDVKTASYGGRGMYITNGKAVDITWVKEVEDGVGHYYDMDGNELMLNPGKTFVCIVLNDAEDKMGVYATKEAFEASRN